MWRPPHDGQQFSSSVAEQVSGGTCRLVQLQGGESDNLRMFSPGDCHSCPDTKACVFRDSQRQPSRLHCWAFFIFILNLRSSIEKLHRGLSPFILQHSRLLTLPRHGEGQGQPRAKDWDGDTRPASVLNTSEPLDAAPVPTPSIVSASPSLFLGTGAPTYVALRLRSVLRVAQLTSKHSPVFSSLEPWALIEEYGGQDSAARAGRHTKN